MTDEEKKAIERLKGIDIKFFLSGSTEQSDYIVDGADKINIAIETVLNLIEKQQAEIENLKNRKERQLKRFSKYKENIENKHEEIYEDLVQEIEKKDKIIDEMAKTIYDYASLEVAINCPAEFEGRYNMDLCKMNAKDRNCLVCIKEYFKKKVEDK